MRFFFLLIRFIDKFIGVWKYLDFLIENVMVFKIILFVEGIFMIYNLVFREIEDKYWLVLVLLVRIIVLKEKNVFNFF